MTEQRPVHPGDIVVSVQEVADGLFAYAQLDGSWWVNTAGFLHSEDEVLVVDTCATAARAHALAATVAERTRGRVRHLVNTHAHGDHTYGNAVFGDAVIVAHENCRTAVLTDRVRQAPPGIWEPNPDWGSLPVTPPTVTFTDRVTVHVGALTVQVIHIGGPAHTTGDVIVWVPEHRVLYTGDLVFHGGTPLMMGGSVPGAIQALELLRSFDAQVLVAGHGMPLRGSEIAPVLDQQERYHCFVLTHAAEGLEAGVTPLQVAKALDLGEFAELLDPERIVLNLHRAYADLDDSLAMDIPTAFTEAVEYNGGRPLHCIA